MLRAPSARPRAGARSRQRGQAIYLALAAIVFLSLMTFATWNIGQMAHGKAQAMNAADAGAYAFANTVARDMNFMAYSNRAMVANHAVVGQLVSLASLSEMIYLAADDLSNLQNLSWIPYVGSIFAAIGEAFEILATVIDEAILPALQGLTSLQNGLIQGISMMQPVARLASVIDIERVGKIVEANDRELKWDLTSGGGWLSTAANVRAVLNGSTERRSDDTAKSRMREVVNLSRDGFTVQREWLPAPPWPVKSKTLFHGGTQLSSDNKTWMGVDAFEMEIWMPWPSPNLWIRLWETGEVAGSSGADDWRRLDHGRLSGNGHRKAHRNMEDRLKDSYGGIQPYYELSGNPRPGEHPSETFVVLVYKPVRNATTPNAAQTFGMDADDSFHLDEGRVRIYGVAAAQVYFRRPARSDQDPTAARLPAAEYQNGTYATLFSPYWQARLTDVPDYVTAGLLMAADR
ncbi:MAG: pilus assembly protein TadG-related protein [Candidatus Accumulibacter sp.]|jgi:hypothetical protein|nr:pilus assembly protein TadG-related protein [Accumulibacter sp.]